MGFTDGLFVEEGDVEEEAKYMNAYDDLELEVETTGLDGLTEVTYLWEILEEDQSEDFLNSVEGDWKKRMMNNVDASGSKLKIPAVNREDVSIMSTESEER